MYCTKNYVVRIIPPDKKSDAKTYEWHGVHEVFRSPTELKMKMMDTFKDKLSSNCDFQLGYLTKKGNSKRWIEQEADLISMYKQFEGSETITIFCDGKSKEPIGNTIGKKRKRINDEPLSDHEEQVKQVALDLSDMHGEKWNFRQYQIWQGCKLTINGIVWMTPLMFP